MQAFQHDPDILILDEPTEGLDPLMQRAVIQIILDFQARGRTIFMSSHVLPEVEKLCQRVAIIRQGEIVALSDVNELRKETVRRMEVVLAKKTPLPDLDVPGVLSVERDDRMIRIMIRGDINPVLRELAKVELEDMAFEQANLEDIFVGYYGQGQEGE